LLSIASAVAFILLREHWTAIGEEDPRKQLAAVITPVLQRRLFGTRGAA
jgi:hypothetical protein